MGYRSNLLVLIYPDIKNPSEEQPLYDQLKVLMATTFKDVSDYWKDPYIKWRDEDHVLMFDIPDVKWYPSYPEVQQFEAMFSAFRDDLEGYCTEFVRIGEESDDTDEIHSGENNQYYLSVRRSIDCNL